MGLLPPLVPANLLVLYRLLGRLARYRLLVLLDLYLRLAPVNPLGLYLRLARLVPYLRLVPANLLVLLPPSFPLVRVVLLVLYRLLVLYHLLDRSPRYLLYRLFERKSRSHHSHFQTEMMWMNRHSKR